MHNAYFDSVANLFPGSGSYGQHGAAKEGLVGLKLGPTLDRWGLFFNLRNGFIHYDKTLVPGSSTSYESTWRYALDLGSTVEFYASRNSTLRLNAGTTLIHYLQGYTDPSRPPTGVLSTQYIPSRAAPTSPPAMSSASDQTTIFCKLQPFCRICTCSRGGLSSLSKKKLLVCDMPPANGNV
jgi:hypothetical protein